MEQIVIACKKIREAARLLAAANERTLAEEAKALAELGGPQECPITLTLGTEGAPHLVGASSFFRFSLHLHAPPSC